MNRQHHTYVDHGGRCWCGYSRSHHPLQQACPHCPGHIHPAGGICWRCGEVA